MAYIETANLDGEKDLKQRNCIPQLYKIFNDGDIFFRGRSKITCNKPDSDLQKFNGKIELNKNISHTITVKQFLYKGTILKNTKWALGVVIYTGAHTKIVLNSQKGAQKQSHLESTVNSLIGLIFLLQIVLCITLAILNSVWFNSNSITHYYLQLDITSTNSTSMSGFISFFSYLLLLNTMIPISLIVSLEIVKYSQAYFMNSDVEMFSKVKKKFVNCNSCSLNEELGQIKYIFSDKTGTLTANKLEFKAAVIADELFGMTINELENFSGGQISKLKRKVTHVSGGTGMFLEYAFAGSEIMDYSVKGKIGKEFNEFYITSKNGKSALKINSTRDVINHYLYCLSLNHTLMVEEKLKPGKEINKDAPISRPNKRAGEINRHGTITTPHAEIIRSDTIQSEKIQKNFEDYDIFYKGSNPDEIIFVDWSRHLGYIYIGGDETFSSLKLLRDLNGINTCYEDQKFDVLKIMEFNSTRGMMSVVIRREDTKDSKNNKIILYSKGGDKKISELLNKNYQPFLLNIQTNATKLAEGGLRVLWIAMKVIDQSEFDEWNKEYELGIKELVDEDLIIKYKIANYRKLEEGLTLIGCTAVEDKLQDNVPKTIKELQTAGINVWVLTGDNLPTAKNIGLMCNLLPKDMDVYEINDDLEKFKNKVCSLYNDIRNAEEIFTLDEIKKAKELLIRSEKMLGTYEEDVQLVQADQNKKEISKYEKRAILYVGLSEMLKKYKQSELMNKAILRGILVESEMLRVVLPSDENTDIKYYGHPLTKLFLDLTLNSQAVICCRVAPKQKALVVRMIKKNIRGAITLSVGDGANDVSMILEADVGVGIYGEEGSQAAMASDYSCGEFKCLRKLILFHGRVNYLRIADMILYFFYKNFLFTIPQFYFAFYCSYSGQTFYDDWFVSLYNMVFTALPLFFKALLEQDVNEEDGEFIKEHIPYTYYQGRESLIFNIKNFFYNVAEAICESILIFFFTTYMMHYSITQNEMGDTADLWANSLTQFTAIILVKCLFRLLDR
jgi:magnesium-transporting ATPase (P-type)